MTALDLDAIRDEFLSACTSHQSGTVETACDCRKKDPRFAIFELIAEVKRLRLAALDASSRLDYWADESDQFRVAQSMRSIGSGLRLAVGQ